jgi:hypothetical protein
VKLQSWFRILERHHRRHHRFYNTQNTEHPVSGCFFIRYTGNRAAN